MAASMWNVCRRGYVLRTLISSTRRRQCLSSSADNTDKDNDFSQNVAPKRIFNISDLDNLEISDDLTTTTVELEAKQAEQEKKSFATLFRETSFVQLGNPKNKFVSGRVFDVQGEDLYISFGGKFHCVCKRPASRPDQYKRGSLVKLSINAFEMASRFLGSDKHITLLEADCTLVGPIISAKDKAKEREKQLLRKDKLEQGKDNFTKQGLADLFKEKSAESS